MAAAPLLKHLDELTTHRISPGDTVKLTRLTGPADGVGTSVFFEVWDPKGAQPDNSHPDSIEIFIILKGTGKAQSDEHEVDLKAGDVLVLPSGSVHHITNTSATDRLYAVTIMANDAGALEGGFESLVVNGQRDELDADDKAALFSGMALLAAD
jgi:mannose-6-phosphate isomerase-like protein (cupin superfamily)